MILGGDIAGKAIVPIKDLGRGRYELVSPDGRAVEVDADTLEQAKSNVAFSGSYPYLCDADEYARMRDDEDHQHRVFTELIVAQIRAWRSLAAERLPERVQCIITPGNDDPFAVDPVLQEPGRTECPEEELAPVGPALLASLGWTNRTPWHTDRECDEDELAERIDHILANANGSAVVLNFHCPPYGSGIDTVIKLDDELRPVVSSGAPVEVPAGSTAIRDAIHRYRPTVGLHGHIHESKGIVRIGDTICINPGSDYGSGWLQGVIVDLDNEGRYVSHVLTSG